jgi:hypothetical protein
MNVHNLDELIFYEKLNVFMTIYIDDILLYSIIVEKHMEHLEYALSKFRQNKLFANRAICEFAQQEINFLGHILLKERVRPDLKKVIGHKRLEKVSHDQRN